MHNSKTKKSDMLKNQKLRVGSRCKLLNKKGNSSSQLVLKINNTGEYGKYIYVGESLDNPDKNTAYGVEAFFSIYELIDDED